MTDLVHLRCDLRAFSAAIGQPLTGWQTAALGAGFEDAWAPGTEAGRIREAQGKATPPLGWLSG
jgi:hypothetical protein